MKVGDYVRTKYGIAKITDISCGEDLWFDNDNIFDEDEKEIFRYNKPSMYSNWADNNIIKSSPKIIDLIEENDFVNHSRVVCIGISTDLKGTHKYLVLEKGNYCPNGNIKSIVTKEQFESMEYKVKE